MPPLPAASMRLVAPCAPLLAPGVWRRAQVLLRGARLAPGASTVTGALGVMGLAAECHVTHEPRVLPRALWSTHHGSQRLWEVLSPRLIPPGAALGLGADDPVERCAGRQSTAHGCDREAVRASQPSSGGSA